MGHLETPNTEKLGTWIGYFTGTSHSHSNNSFHYISQRLVIVIVMIPSIIIIYFVQAYVPLPFVISRENLQFNRLYIL